MDIFNFNIIIFMPSFDGNVEPVLKKAIGKSYSPKILIGRTLASTSLLVRQ